jgi:hypothetical protein
VTSTISPGLMESVETGSWTDFLFTGSRVMGSSALRAGGGVALELPGGPGAAMNRAMGLGWAEPVSAGLLERIIGFYREAQAPSAILMVAPQVLPPDWAVLVRRFGLADTASAMVKLAGEASVVAEQGKATACLDRGLRVGPVPASRAEEWGQVMQRCFRSDVPRLGLQTAGLCGLTGWRLFAVYEGDDIVATGSLRVDGAVGHLFGAATLPSARHRGAQCALIAARAAAAQEAGCAWVIAEAGAEKPGQHNPALHNQLRAGLSARYQRENWIWPGGAARR